MVCIEVVTIVVFQCCSNIEDRASIGLPSSMKRKEMDGMNAWMCMAVRVPP